MDHRDWLRHLPESTVYFLNQLSLPEQRGRYYPCLKGLSKQGQQLSLGYSCFAVKILWTIHHWELLQVSEQKDHIAFIQSFQGQPCPVQNSVAENAFIDPPIYDYLLNPGFLWIRRLWNRSWRKSHRSLVPLVILAETKQAIATLAQIQSHPIRPYTWLPRTPEDIRSYLESFDWSKPWGAGAHFAVICVLLASQAPLFLEEQQRLLLIRECLQVIEGKLDPRTGAYYQGSLPDYGNLVNGAMKVLTGLDWLHVPIHAPERLIETCLASLPAAEGCHLVDTVYVLYRCWRQSNHLKAKIQKYCVTLMEMIRSHFNETDGGFSYYLNRSQIIYYQVPISVGMPVSDIHGTVLMTWAIAMLDQILESHVLSWRVLRP